MTFKASIFDYGSIPISINSRLLSPQPLSISPIYWSNYSHTRLEISVIIAISRGSLVFLIGIYTDNLSPFRFAYLLLRNGKLSILKGSASHSSSKIYSSMRMVANLILVRLLVKICEYPFPHLKARAGIETNRAYTGNLYHAGEGLAVGGVCFHVQPYAIHSPPFGYFQ